MPHTVEEMRPIIQAYQKRKCTRAEFCSQHGISVPVMQYWVTRFNQMDEPPGDKEPFQSVHVVRSTARHIEIETSIGLVIRIPV